MLPYLINATITWTLALTLFDLMFRRSGHHAANRTYLLGTLLLGVALPLIAPVMNSVPVVNPGVRLIAQMRAPTTIRLAHPVPAAAATLPTPPGLSAADLLVLLYVVGVCFFAFKLIREAWLLYGLARRSTRRSALGYLVRETGTAHAPFSFFGCVFLSRIDAFSEEELRMVVHHELRHARLLHSVDVLLLETLRLFLWFHPAVWVYGKRLRAVHEFQADASVPEDRTAYGHFLLRQALLGAAPTLATSIIHSTIKSRIQMLTKTTSPRSWIYLAVLPLVAVSLVCCSRQEEKKTSSTASQTSANGNVFEMSNMVQQPVFLREESSDKVDTTFITVLPQPVKMNGETIYQSDNVTKPVQYAGPEANATLGLFNQIKGQLRKLRDGTYNLSMPYVIVDKAGRVAYVGDADIHGSSGTIVYGEGAADSMIKFEEGVLTFSPPEPSAESSDIIDRTRHEIVIAIHHALAKGLKFSPAQKDGKPVIAYLGESAPFTGGGHIVVKNGEPQLVKSTIVLGGDAGLPPHKIDWPSN